MAEIPSVGDIIMLSQLAWRIGRAFTGGSKDAPQDFLQIETQITFLSKALKLLAEALFSNSDDNILLHASAETKSGVARLLSSCQRTLQDLDSLVAEHQTTTKKNTDGGWTVVRAWSPMVLANYKYMMWTSEGGTLQTLKDLLQMHTNTLRLTTQAVQSKSTQTLESAVRSVAGKISLAHRESAGDLDDRIDEINRMVDAVANGNGASIDMCVDMDSPELESPSARSLSDMGDFPPPPPPLKSARRALSPPVTRSELSGAAVGDISDNSRPSSHKSGSSGPSSGSINPRWSALTGMSSMPLSPSAASLARQSQFSGQSMGHGTAMSFSSIGTEPLPPHLMATDRNSSIVSMEPLPPAMAMDIDSRSSLDRNLDNLSLQPRMPAKAIPLARSMATPQQTQEFVRDAFKNSAILCDVRGLAIEYTRSKPRDEDELDSQSPYDVELVQAMEACRICIVKKRETLPQGETHISTSIWAFSDDGSIRLQQNLQDNTQYIPYSSYFSPEKISLTIPSEIKYHDIIHGSRPLQVTSTNWINYVVADAQAAASFQNELMSRTLIAQFKTESTLRLHEGFTGVLSYQEQMCGMENLRVWEDEITRGIFCMIHFSAQFRPGYFAFWLNSSRNPVRVKDDGRMEVKVKGLRIPHGEDPKGKGKMPVREVERPGQRRGSDKGDSKRFVTGAKIEFASEVEKFAFLDVVKQVQQTMIPLPDLM